ncbi:uncharacterized protein LOC111018913 [Momordica charantia]|uniref:Uncharacterized protein LOC111018913 n=1 Tax=Momordica charantia TaxID=3673 RepID=A0A6J1DBX9_MOMCH|nr:uncharacterized protein LOC111018913 [Momordica charantia]
MRDVETSLEVFDVSPLQEVQRKSPSNKSKNNKRKTISSDDVVPEVRVDGITGLANDPKARVGATFDIYMRFKIEPSSAGIKEKVAKTSSVCFDRGLQQASKFVIVPRSGIKKIIDYTVKVHAVSCHAAIIMKSKLDDRDLIMVNEREAFSVALEVATTLERELKEARVENEVLKSKLEAKFKSDENEVEHQQELFKSTYVIVKGLENEKFKLMRRNDHLTRDAKTHQSEVKELKVEVELHKAKLSNGVLLEEAFQAHLDFDVFVNDFSDVDFKFLMKGIMEVALDLDLEPVKQTYTKKWASGPIKTLGP